MPEIQILDAEENRWNTENADEFLWWPRVLWIDPGVVSGVATVWFDPKAVFAGAPLARCILARSEMYLHGPENGPNGQVSRFLRLRRNLTLDDHSTPAPGLVTGIESFTPRQMNMDPAFLAPVRIRAAIEWKLSMTRPVGAEVLGDGVQLFAQSPSDALTSFNNDRLTALNCYTPGPDHIRDATRHCLLWVRKLKGKGMDFFKLAHGYEEEWFSHG